MSDNQQTLAEAAEEAGLSYFDADARTLTLDLDETPTEKQRAALGIFKESILYRLGSQLNTVSRNGKAHAYLRLTRPLDEPARLLLEVCFGSDPKRAVLTHLKPGKGHGLIETDEEAERVNAWFKTQLRLEENENGPLF